MKHEKIACAARPANLPLFKFLCQAFSISADFTLPDTKKALMCFGSDADTVQFSFEPLLPDDYENVSYETFCRSFTAWINNNVIGPECKNNLQPPPTNTIDADAHERINVLDSKLTALMVETEPWETCPDIDPPPPYTLFEDRLDALSQNYDKTLDALEGRVCAQSYRIGRQNTKYKKLVAEVNDVLSARGNAVTANAKAIQDIRIDALNEIEAGRKRDKALDGVMTMLGNIVNRLEALEAIKPVEALSCNDFNKKPETPFGSYMKHYCDAIPLREKEFHKHYQCNFVPENEPEFLVYETAKAADTQAELLHGKILRVWVARHTECPESEECDALEPGKVINVSTSSCNALILRLA